jgi:hypothetical protein
MRANLDINQTLVAEFRDCSFAVPDLFGKSFYAQILLYLFFNWTSFPYGPALPHDFLPLSTWLAAGPSAGAHGKQHAAQRQTSKMPKVTTSYRLSVLRLAGLVMTLSSRLK